MTIISANDPPNLTRSYTVILVLVIVLSRVCDAYRRGLDWWLGLLITLPHDSELQVITASSLISTFYKSLLQRLGIFSCSVFTSRFLATAYNSGDSSASALTPFPADRRVTTELSSKFFTLITIRHRPHRKHSSCIVGKACLQRRCISKEVACILPRECVYRVAA
jgi:hypothetical protein